MHDVALIREGMEVIGSDGEHVGTVDKLEGSMIKLTKNDPQAQGEHHWLSTDWISRVDAHVHLTIDSGEAIEQWVNRSSMESAEWQINSRGMSGTAPIGNDIGDITGEKSLGSDI